MLEAGPAFEPGSYRVWLDHLMAGADPFGAFWDDPRTEHEEFGLRGSRLFVKGGTTNHWGGETPRFKPEDFELRSRTGLGADWPISYDDLSPYYARAESLLGVAGDSDDDDPPRHGMKYPFPAAPFTLGNRPMIETYERLRMAYSHMPVARNGDKCITTGTCDYCPVNARYSASYDLMLLQDEYDGRLEVRTEAPALSLLMDGKKHAGGVSFLNHETGARETLEGDAVVVCGGTVESAKLLLASTPSDWPDGVGNASGHVGRHLVGHPLVSVGGVRPGNPDKLDQELVGIVTLLCRHFDTPEYQREGKLLFTMSDRSTTLFEREILANVSRAEIDAKMTSELPLSIGGSFEQFESPENRVSLGAGTTRHGLATTEIEFGANATTRKAHEAHAQRLTRIHMSTPLSRIAPGRISSNF